MGGYKGTAQHNVKSEAQCRHCASALCCHVIRIYAITRWAIGGRHARG
jgi:hypothetical protein